MNDTERLDWLDAHPYAGMSRTLQKQWQVTANVFDDNGYEQADTVREAIDKAAENERKLDERARAEWTGGRNRAADPPYGHSVRFVIDDA